MVLNHGDWASEGRTIGRTIGPSAPQMAGLTRECISRVDNDSIKLWWERLVAAGCDRGLGVLRSECLRKAGSF